MLRRRLPALLYAALAVFANVEPGAALSPEQRAGIEALRAGDMRKLILADDPKPAPELAFQSREGQETTLSASNGKVRLVNFWATWCAPCREEMPSLEALQNALGGDDFTVLAIATGRNPPEAIDRFSEAAGLTTLPIWLDPQSRLAWGMGVAGLPVTVLLDREGREVARLTGGADWSTAEAQGILKKLIAPE